MRNLIKGIMKTKYKYAFVGIIIMIIIFSIGVVMITSLDSMVQDQHISYIEFTVVDKYISEQGDHYYMVVGDNNQTFDIRDDDVGVDIFNRLDVGRHYHFVVQEPKNGSDNIVHIIQVYNETN